MRKGMWSAAALIVLVSGAPVLWGSNVQAADNKVSMTDQLKFEPATITVQAGTKVVWQNDGYAQHDVKAKDGSFNSNKLLNKGETFEFTFNTPGSFDYVCTPHEGAGMTGVVKVVGGGATPTTAAPTATTAAPTATTATTAPAQGATTTTTAKAAAGASSTTTTTAPPNGATSTTLAPSVTPTSAPETASETTATTAAQAGGEQAGAEHDSEGAQEKKKHKNSPIGIAFASVSTLLLVAIAGKLLASKP